MKILREIDLGGPMSAQVRQTHSGNHAVVVHGGGSYAYLSLAQARALYEALRTLDSEGLLG